MAKLIQIAQGNNGRILALDDEGVAWRRNDVEEWESLGTPFDDCDTADVLSLESVIESEEFIATISIEPDAALATLRLSFPNVEFRCDSNLNLSATGNDEDIRNVVSYVSERSWAVSGE